MKLVTYNIKNNARSRGKPWKGRRDEILSLIKDQDIMCLQELTPWWVVWLRWKLRKTHRFHGRLFGTGTFVSRELRTIYSQRVKLFDRWIDVLRDFDRMRFVQHTIIRGDGYKFYSISNVHLGFNQELYENVENLRKYLRIEDIKTTNLVIAGDFNVQYGTTKYNYLLNRFNVIDPNEGRYTTFHGWRNDPSREVTIDFTL